MLRVRFDRIQTLWADVIQGRVWVSHRHAMESLKFGLEKEPRILEYGVEVLPWQNFLERLWSGELGV